ncbi:GcrA family cell cycle regulator [Anaerobacillus sp. CMMVII]|uniref:GcrA family cell cycle regulator n=1 Tax=Anaerobacillus sp. CMMVII TaxID=2755588 RepID=UPI0021B6EA01|nr:GcrA family cell cycle regulator [Anaerobacillus sp. CMMVII]
MGDPTLSYDGITVNQLCTATNIPYRTIKYWIKHKGFPVKYKVFAEEMKVMVVSYPTWWKWAEENKRLIDFAEVEENILGAEPDWVKIKRGADKIRYHKKPHNEPWSEKDDKRLISMVNAFRYSYPDISRELKRTEAAIKRRLWELGVKAKPVRMNNHIKWTNAQTEQLIDLFEKGYSLETIAERLDKSANGVRGKLERMGYKFRQKKVDPK